MVTDIRQHSGTPFAVKEILPERRRKSQGPDGVKFRKKRNDMMKKSVIAASLIALLSAPATALQVEVTGTAPVISENYEAARTRAIEDGLRQALRETGGTLSAASEMAEKYRPGMPVAGKGDIRSFRLTEERRSQKRVKVTMRVFLTPHKAGCRRGTYAKSIVTAKFSYGGEDVLQATAGQLDGLNTVITERLTEKLGEDRTYLAALPWVDADLGLGSTAVTRDNIRTGVRDRGAEVRYLAEQSDSQYVAAAVIEDLSLLPPEGNFITKNFNDPVRNFSVTLSLYDGLTGQQVLRRRYSEQALWEDSGAPLSASNPKFWAGEYGRKLDSLLDSMAQDIRLYTMCRSPAGRIVAVDGVLYHINLGSLNGIRKGDRFEIRHLYDFTGKGELPRKRSCPSGTLMKSVQVEEDGAILRAEGQPSESIQIGDLAILQ